MWVNGLSCTYATKKMIIYGVVVLSVRAELRIDKNVFEMILDVLKRNC